MSGVQNRKRWIQRANVAKKLDGSMESCLEVLEPTKKVKNLPLSQVERRTEYSRKKKKNR